MQITGQTPSSNKSLQGLVEESEDLLTKLGQKLKKNGISIDLINLESSSQE